ncbi:Wadjet anti-phage system protein JetA family protein [Citrobacter sp. U14242]|uniref:Wadjet anti-phage system protein JetA family protein n=1 Tax=Citrobacter sp. U14242 TaxID=3390192 RepID=UPI00397DAFDD
MLSAELSPAIFKPLASNKNSSVYVACIWALYDRLVRHQHTLDECHPKEAREIIRRALVQYNLQLDNDDMPEIPDPSETDDTHRIYSFLRETGWLHEQATVGYRRICYIPQIPSQLVAALDMIKQGRIDEVGATCKGVYLQLVAAIQDPRENASQIAIARSMGINFLSSLSAMQGQMRDLIYQATESESGLKIIKLFFEDFLKGILLKGYSHLKNSNHPYRYREITIQKALQILTDDVLMDNLTRSLCSADQQTSAEKIRRELKNDLNTIIDTFENIDRLLSRIDDYRRSLTTRTRETIEYMRSSLPGLDQRLIDLIAKTSTVPDEAMLSGPGDIYSSLSEYRLRRPSTPHVEPQATELETPYKNPLKLAENMAMREYLERRRENPARVHAYLEQHLGKKSYITSDELKIETLDDMLAYIQIRRLLYNAVPLKSRYYKLAQLFRVSPVDGEYTENEYLTTPKLKIERSSPVQSKETLNAK